MLAGAENFSSTRRQTHVWCQHCHLLSRAKLPYGTFVILGAGVGRPTLAQHILKIGLALKYSALSQNGLGANAGQLEDALLLQDPWALHINNLSIEQPPWPFLSCFADRSVDSAPSNKYFIL